MVRFVTSLALCGMDCYQGESLYPHDVAYPKSPIHEVPLKSQVWVSQFSKIGIGDSREGALPRLTPVIHSLGLRMVGRDTSLRLRVVSGPLMEVFGGLVIESRQKGFILGGVTLYFQL